MTSTTITRLRGPGDASRSPGAARMRRYRLHKREGVRAIDLAVDADAVRMLIDLGWLPDKLRDDRKAVTGAMVALATCALALRIRPGGF